MENGSPAKNIPARPHLRAGVREAQDAIEARLKGAAKAALDGRPAEVEKGLQAAGVVAESAVKRKISEGPFEPLAPGTLAKRKRRGRTGEKPLLDTAQYQRGIPRFAQPEGLALTLGEVLGFRF